MRGFNGDGQLADTITAPDNGAIIHMGYYQCAF